MIVWLSQQAGLYDKWTQDSLEESRRQGRIKKRERQQRQHKEENGWTSGQRDQQALTLMHMQGPLVLQLLGLLLGGLTFAAEIMTSRFAAHWWSLTWCSTCSELRCCNNGSSCWLASPWLQGSYPHRLPHTHSCTHYINIEKSLSNRNIFNIPYNLTFQRSNIHSLTSATFIVAKIICVTTK